MPKLQSRVDRWSLAIGHWALGIGHSLDIGIWTLVIFLSTMIVNAEESSVLHLTNGGFLPGELKSSEQPTVLRWQSTRFTQPFEFSLGGVTAVQYAIPPKLPKPTGGVLPRTCRWRCAFR